MRLECAAVTHLGRRENNEDALYAAPALGVFAVADGMGGYEGGEVAAQLTVWAFEEFFARVARDRDCTWPFGFDRGLTLDENLVAMALRLAHREICRRKTGRLARMGATVAALRLSDGGVTIAHVGDSRVYRWRDGVLDPLTRDHSLYAELEAAEVDVPPRADCPFTNVVTRALGMAAADAAPELRREAARPGDVYLLCTDGLSEPLPASRIGELLGSLAPRPACEALVGEAYARGGRDNITAVIVRVVET